MIEARSKQPVSKGPCGGGEERARVARRQAARRVVVFRELDRLPVGVRPAVAGKLRLAQAELGRVAAGIAGANERRAECGLLMT